MLSSTIREKVVTDNRTKLEKDYLTTTELAKLCGVSRFTILNWIKGGEIDTIRTVGGRYRIPTPEAISLLETLDRRTSHRNKRVLTADALGHCWEYPKKTNCDNECGDCLIHGKKLDYCFVVVRQFGKDVIRCKGDCLECEYFGEFFGFYRRLSQLQESHIENSEEPTEVKQGFLYNFVYGVGRGAQILKKKKRGKVK